SGNGNDMDHTAEPQGFGTVLRFLTVVVGLELSGCRHCSRHLLLLSPHRLLEVVILDGYLPSGWRSSGYSPPSWHGGRNLTSSLPPHRRAAPRLPHHRGWVGR